MELTLFGLALSAAIITTEPTPEGRRATTYISRAIYYQGGYNELIEPLAKRLENKYVPKNLQKIGIGASFIYRLAVDNRIGYSWTF